ncbi:MAG: JAB domain-containing protein [Lachnospiraceae bacterium]|jgi:DNA repair protein RadC|nr:JAB domain-containing protein [Lachnospiraceae bacterium]
MLPTEYAGSRETEVLKPYEKFLRYGAEQLSDEELLAVIIRTGKAGRDALTLAHDVLHHCGNSHGLAGLHHVEVAQLMEIDGIGEVKAIKIKCIAELSKRISRQRILHESALTGPASIAAYFMEDLRHLEYEKCIAVYLDSKCHILAEMTLSLGSINSTQIPVRELFKNAFRANAAQIILLHNHPSGDPTPSKDDLHMTERIINACKLIGLTLADHIIIGNNTYISFREKGFF